MILAKISFAVLLGALMLTSTIAQTSKYGALAVDRSNGFYFGFAYDNVSAAEAETRAAEECTKRGGSCSVVLSWVGAGCGAYRTVNGNVGTAYGWGVAETRAGAEAIAVREGLKRSGGQPVSNNVWACNSVGSGDFKTLKNEDEQNAESTLTKEKNTTTNSDETSDDSVEGESVDGNFIAVGTPSGKIIIQNSSDKKTIREFAAHSSPITVVSFSIDSSMIASGDRNGTVKIWNVGFGQLIRTIKSHNSAITMAIIGADNASLMTATGEEMTDVKGWDLKTGSQVLGNP